MDILFDLLFSTDIDVAGLVNIKLVLGLLALGFIFKHSIKKLNNEFIPVILIVASLIVTFMNVEVFDRSNIANAFMNAILTAAVAIGMHQGGKGFLKAFKASASSAVGTFKDEITDEDKLPPEDDS